MKKTWVVLGNGFVFVSLWLSMVAVLGKLRLFSYAQTQGGIASYLQRAGNDDIINDLFYGFFLAVVIAYAFCVSKRRN